MFKKSLLLMTLFFALFGVGRAQTTVEIGDGTTASYYTPINSYYTYSITEQLYTAEEIGMAGTINSISFYWAWTAEKNYDITVYMANVDATDLTTGISLADADEVFDGNIVVPSTAGWVTIDLDTPFDYDGTSNLLIGVNKTDGSDWFSGNTWRYTAATNMARYSQNDYNVYDTSTTPEYVTSNRPNIQMDITAGSGPTCDKPETLEASNITTNSAVLTWTGGSSTIFNVEYKKAADDDWTHIAAVSATTYSLSGLTSNTAYQARVQSVCSYGEGSMTSGWKSVNFNTPAGIPLVEEFGTTTPTGWNMYTGLLNSDGTATLVSTTYGWSFGTSNLFTDNHARCNIYGNYQRWLVLPALAMENNVELAFEVALTVYSSTSNNSPTAGDQPDDKFIVLISNDNMATWEVLRQWDNAGSEYVYDEIPNDFERHNIDLSSYAGQSVTIAFYGESTESNGDNNLHIDNVSIDYIPTCPKPSRLAAGTLGKRFVELSWTNGDTETAWQLCLNGDETNLIPVTTNPYTLTGLDPETDYTVKLRANCGGGDFSDWTNEVSFTTEEACPAPTNVTVSDIEPFAATVNWEGTAGNYNLRYREARGFNYGFEDAEPFVVDEFPPCTTYDGDGLPTYGISGYTMPNNTANYVGSVVSFNEYWDAHSGNLMGAFMDAIPDTDAGITANDDYFITPELTIAAGDHFIFWARSVTDQYGLERMKVGIYGGNGTITSYLAGSATEYVQVPVAWTEYDYDLTAYVGQTIQLAINCVSADAFALLFDDLFVGNPNDNTWDETINDIAANTYTLTGLSDNTYYEVQVQSACGTDGESEWVNADMFQTPDGCGKPTNLAAADITTEEATLSWEGYWNTYNLKYRTAESRVTYYFNDFNDENTEGWTRDYFIYGITDPIYGVAGENNYFLEMGWNSTSEETIISCELPDYDFGSYVEFYYFGYQTANTFQVGTSTTTNDADAFTWSEPIDAPLQEYTRYQETLGTGVKYIAWKATASAQAATIFIDDFGIFGETIEAGDWETLTGVTSPYELSGLADDTEYEWQVQGINASCTGGVTEWSKVAKFTTLSNCEAPSDLEATDITDSSATLNWVGLQDSYEVRYRALEHYANQVFSEDFTGGIGNWTLVDCHTNSGADADYGYFMFYYTTNPPQYLISPLLPSEAGGMNLSFTYARNSDTYVETFQLGFSTTDKDVDSFTWEDEVSADGDKGVWYDYTTVVPDGAKFFAIKCTSDDQLYLYVSNFTINDGTITPTGEWIEESVRDDQYLEISGLEPGGVAYEWQVRGEGCDDMDWSASSYFYTLETPATQVTDLTEGWNWFSIYVAIEDGEEEEAMLKLQESLGTNGLTIKSIDDFTTYASGDWGDSGDLDAVDNLNMYMIQVGADCTVELDGTPADPGDYTITIVNGWNWVGFPSAEVISIEDAFADFEAADGDQIKTKDDYSTYADGWGDTGDLEELTPGQGFLYYSSSSTPKTLIISTGSGKRAVSAKPVVVRSAMPFIKEVKSARIELPSKSLK